VPRGLGHRVKNSNAALVKGKTRLEANPWKRPTSTRSSKKGKVYSKPKMNPRMMRTGVGFVGIRFHQEIILATTNARQIRR